MVQGETFATNAEQEEHAAWYEANRVENVDAAPVMSEECAMLVAELETSLAAFEQTHDLPALYAIERLTVDEARAHPERQAARADLPGLVKLINYLEYQKDQGALSEEEWQRLLTRYKVMTNAVGTLNGDFVVHDR